MPRKNQAGEISIERNITLRSDGMAYRVRMMAYGQRFDETFHTLNEARAFRDRKRSDITLDPTAALVLAHRQIRREASVTLEDLLQRYLTEVTPTKKGAKEESYRIKRLQKFRISSTPVRLLNRETLSAFLQSERARSQNDLRKYLMIISAVFSVAVRRWGMKLENPVKQVEVPSNGPARKRRLEPGEYEYLTAALAKSRNRHMAPLVVFAIETACRRGELLSLKWKDVGLQECIAVLHDTKNGEDRVIPLSRLAVKTVSELARPISGGLVFPVTEEQLRRAFEFAKQRARRAYEKDCAAARRAPDPDFMRDLRFHDLRHEATSRLFEKGLNVMEAASVTGHKTLAMLKGYTHLRAQRLAQKLG